MPRDIRCPNSATSSSSATAVTKAARIPVEFELPGDAAIMHRDGDRLVIEPMRKRGLVALLKSTKPIDEGFPEIGDPAPPPECVL